MEKERAGKAFQRLVERFLMDPQQAAATARLNTILEGYFTLSVRAAAEGIPEGDRKRFIKEEMIRQGLIDVSDLAKADEEYTIISQGYELNRPYWDRQLGRVRRFRNDLLDLPGELNR